MRERRPLSDMRGLLPRAPLLCPQGQSLGPTLARSNYHGPLAQPEGRLGLAQLPPCPIPTHCFSPPSTLQSFPHLHLLVFSYSSPLSFLQGPLSGNAAMNTMLGNVSGAWVNICSFNHHMTCFFFLNSHKCKFI